MNETVVTSLREWNFVQHDNGVSARSMYVDVILNEVKDLAELSMQ
jgi:hypothetical protein